MNKVSEVQKICRDEGFGFQNENFRFTMVGDFISLALTYLIGLGFVGGILGFMFWRNSARWRRLAEAYERPWSKPEAQKGFQYGVLYGDNVAYNSYAGILSIGVHQNGFALRLMRPFGFFYPPLFIPFSDIRGWDQFWYLNSKSVELQFSQIPELKMVMPTKQVEWIQKTAGISLDLADQTSPHKDKPTFWHAVTILLAMCTFGFCTLLFLGYITVT